MESNLVDTKLSLISKKKILINKNKLSNTIKVPNKIVYELCIETCRILQDQQDILKKINWTNGEANIDTEYSELVCECCRAGWLVIKQKYKEYNKTNIICKIPDINITFIYPCDNKENSDNKKIELKSSKNEKIPGSTIKNLNINQPLIYCLRPSNISDKYKIRYSQYYQAMGLSSIDLFQDRTPRPSVNFQKMNDIDNILPFENKNKDCWLDHYAKCAINRINSSISCKTSWQDEMVKIMKKYIIDDYLKNTSIEQIEIDKITIQLENITV